MTSDCILVHAVLGCLSLECHALCFICCSLKILCLIHGVHNSIFQNKLVNEIVWIGNNVPSDKVPFAIGH